TSGPFLINKGFGALPEFKAINEAAYWDYQRVRVYARTNKVVKKASRQKSDPAASHPAHRIVAPPRPTSCPNCGSKDLEPAPGHGRSLVRDIKVLRHGLKAWVTHPESARCYCPKCQQRVGPSLKHPFAL